MNQIGDIRTAADDCWIPEIYEDKIRPQRTRSVELEIPSRENSPVIHHTLLGIELQIGRRRIACPDLATARYLRVFARIGCVKFAVPYDITMLSSVADELEAGWHKTLLLFEKHSAGSTPQGKGRTRSALIREMRDEIVRIGAGEKMPLFNQNTKQRSD